MIDDRSASWKLTRAFYLKRLQRQRSQFPTQMSAQVGWSSYEIQLYGFKLATELPGIDWRQMGSVLDIGCGYGGLAEFLRSQRGFVGEYTGIDLMPEYIDSASSLHQHRQNTFITADFFQNDWQDQQFDVVISLGLISVNFDYPDQAGDKSLRHAQRSIVDMLALAHQAVSFYFPNQNNLTVEKNRADIAYYPIRKIDELVHKSSAQPCQYYSILPYPGSQDRRTMARLVF